MGQSELQAADDTRDRLIQTARAMVLRGDNNFTIAALPRYLRQGQQSPTRLSTVRTSPDRQRIHRHGDSAQAGAGVQLQVGCYL